MNGALTNPYASRVGTRIGDILNTFLGRDKLQTQGYLDASKAMADIDNTRANTAKIMAELAATDSANAIGPRDLAPGVEPRDWEAQQMYEQQGIYGTNPVSPGMAGPPAPVRERPDFLTDMDQSAMQNARLVDAVLKKTGGSGTGVNSILEALQGGSGSAMGVSGLPESAQDLFKDMLPISVRGIALQHLQGNPGDVMGAIATALAKADEASYNEILRFMGTIPLANLGILTQGDPNVAIPQLIERAQQIRQGLGGYGPMAPGNAPGGYGYDYEYDPRSGTLKRPGE